MSLGDDMSALSLAVNRSITTVSPDRKAPPQCVSELTLNRCRAQTVSLHRRNMQYDQRL